MGQEARRFADFLKQAGFSCWQVLPLVQTGYGDSPYQSVYGASATRTSSTPNSSPRRGFCAPASFPPSARRRGRSISTASAPRASPCSAAPFPASIAATLPSVLSARRGVFRLRAVHGGARTFRRGLRPLAEALRLREPAALSAFRAENGEEYLFWQFVQYEFLRQWKALKAYVNGIGIRIVGDIPLYMAYDSVDVWAAPHLFKLNKNLTRKGRGRSARLFFRHRQLWGNPVYDWKAHEGEGTAGGRNASAAPLNFTTPCASTISAASTGTSR